MLQQGPDEINKGHLADQENVIIAKSQCTGVHARAINHSKGGAAKKIPSTSYCSIGLMVKLITNLAPELRLYNNARGLVRDFFFLDGDVGYDRTQQSRMPVVMVEFPSYTGPPVSQGLADAGRSTWLQSPSWTSVAIVAPALAAVFRSFVQRPTPFTAYRD